jgi:uncharacterized alkaline shock family protein YloU
MTTQPLTPAEIAHDGPSSPFGGLMIASGGAREDASTLGTTTIADEIVAKVAARAAREIPGVHDTVGGLSRTIGAVRDRVPGGRSNAGRGVKVEVGEQQAAISIELVVEYGVVLPEVIWHVRENVIFSVERITGLEVVEVHVAVNDVLLPDDDPFTSAELRAA